MHDFLPAALALDRKKLAAFSALGAYWRLCRSRSSSTVNSNGKVSMIFWTMLLIIHGLLAVALLGAITHQAVSVWMPVRSKAGIFVTRFRAVPSTSYVKAIIVLYVVTFVMGRGYTRSIASRPASHSNSCDFSRQWESSR